MLNENMSKVVKGKNKKKKKKRKGKKRKEKKRKKCSFMFLRFYVERA